MARHDMSPNVAKHGVRPEVLCEVNMGSRVSLPQRKKVQFFRPDQALSILEEVVQGFFNELATILRVFIVLDGVERVCGGLSKVFFNKACVEFFIMKSVEVSPDFCDLRMAGAGQPGMLAPKSTSPGVASIGPVSLSMSTENAALAIWKACLRV